MTPAGSPPIIEEWQIKLLFWGGLIAAIPVALVAFVATAAAVDRHHALMGASPAVAIGFAASYLALMKLHRTQIEGSLSDWFIITAAMDVGCAGGLILCGLAFRVVLVCAPVAVCLFVMGIWAALVQRRCHITNNYGR